MSSLPTGTVTFLFTDVEGSTKMWERSPESMSGALARQDEILRRAIEARSGFVFKTVGDAFCATFASATGALEAALAVQCALFAESWEENCRSWARGGASHWGGRGARRRLLRSTGQPRGSSPLRRPRRSDPPLGNHQGPRRRKPAPRDGAQGPRGGHLKWKRP